MFINEQMKNTVIIKVYASTIVRNYFTHHEQIRYVTAIQLQLSTCLQHGLQTAVCYDRRGASTIIRLSKCQSKRLLLTANVLIAVGYKLEKSCETDLTIVVKILNQSVKLKFMRRNVCQATVCQGMFEFRNTPLR